MPEKKAQENQMSGLILAPRGMFNLRSPLDVSFLKVARQEPSVRDFLGNLYREAAKWEGNLPKGWTDKSVDKFWKSLTGDVKHKVKKCINRMKMTRGVTDPGAFCASLADKVEGTAWRHERRRAAAVDPAIKRGINEFVKEAQKTINDYWKKQGFTFAGPPTLSIMWGQKFARIVRTDEDGSSRSVFGFVDMTNGDLLKAEGWKRPAKHARGSVLDKSTWARAHGPHGMAYMRAAARVASRYMKKAGQVAQTIADQMGGVRRLKMFLGATVTALPGDKGLGIKFPNKQRSKGNYVEIIYNRGSDLYDVTFFNLSARGKKPVRKETGVYADMLVDMFEKQTGWYLRLASKLAARYLQAKYVTVTPAYGRDYRSKKEAIADWDAGKDFILQDITSRWDGKPINKEDAKRAGFTSVNIRYKRNTQVAVVKLALKVEPIPAYEAEKIQQSIEYHRREAADSTSMADEIEKAWGKWDLRTLTGDNVLSRREAQYVQSALKEGRTNDRYMEEIGKTIKEHLEALRTEAWEHRKEAQAIEKAWQKHDMRALKKMRVIR